MNKILFILLIFAIQNCAASIRTQFSKGEDNKDKVTRIVIPTSLAVLSVDTLKPSMSNIFDNREGQNGITKNLNLLPGKYTLEVAFTNRDIE